MLLVLVFLTELTGILYVCIGRQRVLIRADELVIFYMMWDEMKTIKLLKSVIIKLLL